MESTIPGAFGHLARFAERFRALVKNKLTETHARRLFWERVLSGPIAEMVFTHRTEAAELALRNQLDQTANAQTLGEVYLIGAGPGDPDLLTFRALRLMQQADVVVYDRLVSPQILDMTRRDAEKIYVGKQRALHSLPQESINNLLAELALSGKRVARLKGGDPFIFGRGGEEIETLVAQGIHFQVVPGITAASGCSSYAGIPLTHRDHAQSCTFVTGHLKDGSINLDWHRLAAPNQTIVIYMGLVGLEAVCRAMMEHGCSGDHPIAIIQQGTTPEQHVITATLATMPEKAFAANIKPPTLIIIGTVVTLHDKLNWFEHHGQSENAEKNHGW
ncbi:MAG: uroporphyrinogen-III C-methyltransferase [Methylomonas sp.]|nr:MAG: uroporphyrinogen-III C-methyltransferase [Methylomonas sp.]